MENHTVWAQRKYHSRNATKCIPSKTKEIRGQSNRYYPKSVEDQGCTPDKSETKVTYDSGREGIFAWCLERHNFKGNMWPFLVHFGRYGVDVVPVAPFGRVADAPRRNFKAVVHQ